MYNDPVVLQPGRAKMASQGRQFVSEVGGRDLQVQVVVQASKIPQRFVDTDV